jgi:hypothetical protein
MRNVRESEQTKRAKRAGRRWANFVIRRGGTAIRPSSPIRSSFNAEKLKYQNPAQLGPYEIRMASGTKATNYEKGVK